MVWLPIGVFALIVLGGVLGVLVVRAADEEITRLDERITELEDRLDHVKLPR